MLSKIDAASFLAGEVSSLMNCKSTKKVLQALSQSLQDLHQAQSCEVSALLPMTELGLEQPELGCYQLVDGDFGRLLQVFLPQVVGTEVGVMGSHLVGIAQKWLAAVKAFEDSATSSHSLAPKVTLSEHDTNDHQEWFSHLDRCIATAAYQGYAVACIRVDIKAFKAIHEVMGQDMTGSLVYELGNRMMTMLRKHDRVVRFGEAEFGIILDRLPQPDSIGPVVQRFLNTLQSPPSPLVPWKGVRLGVALYPSDGLSANALVETARQRLVDAKAREVLDDERWARDIRTNLEQIHL